MIVNTDQLPDWAIYVAIGGAVFILLLTIWAVEYVISCLTCGPCRKCYGRIKLLLYVLCCCCLCNKSENKYTVVDNSNTQ
jgi:hypothetical protein